MPGGPRNPLGARAMYLWQGNKDTLYRIHGTFEPSNIGKNVSSGCIRMINQDVIDLYQRASLGARSWWFRHSERSHSRDDRISKTVADEMAADDDQRSLTSLVESLLSDYLKRKDY